MAKDKVLDDEQVNWILGSFKDELVADWTETDRDMLVEMNFKDFMKTFREQWLPRDWDQTILAELKKVRLNPSKEPFEAWTCRI